MTVKSPVLHGFRSNRVGWKLTAFYSNPERTHIDIWLMESRYTILLKVTWYRLREKKLNQLVRLAITRIPLLSAVGFVYYRLIFKTPIYNYINRNSIRIYAAHPPQLSALQQNILSKVSQNGIYFGHVDVLSEREGILNDLGRDAEIMLAQSETKRLWEKGIRPPKLRGIGRNVNNKYLPKSFVEYFVSDTVLDVVNSYMGQLCRLNYVDAWDNLPANNHDFIYPSEKWHRDHEDLKIFKIMIYLNHIDQDTGAFAYIHGSHASGKFGSINPVNPPRGVVISRHELERIQSENNDAIKIYSGEFGALIACDCSGYHSGGRPLANSRVVLVAIYTSNAGIDNHRYRLPDNFDATKLSRQSRYALHLSLDSEPDSSN